ncbi:hypothetical protein WH95_18450 [Kiloniella litopenaei]|uniref:Reverse transcriptase N-terminal domain-containing protein n=1 Tax=Kiloniella litopenaei TaxID=1549748 RepID=A0A0M2R7B2_9PROT|nr:hypothetical protein [Kiloniella litopenaei]KKJ75423.1 hypothetical protein WH95_18450 [Kiloniella litopenaei]
MKRNDWKKHHARLQEVTKAGDTRGIHAAWKKLRQSTTQKLIDEMPLTSKIRLGISRMTRGG